MSSVTVKLSSEQKRMINERVGRGEFESAEAFVEQPVQRALLDPPTHSAHRMLTSV